MTASQQHTAVDTKRVESARKTETVNDVANTDAPDHPDNKKIRKMNLCWRNAVETEELRTSGGRDRGRWREKLLAQPNSMHRLMK